MKILFIFLLNLFSSHLIAQTIDPGALGSSVGVLNQMTDESTTPTNMNQQDQQEQQYREQVQREKAKWDQQKKLDDARIEKEQKEEHGRDNHRPNKE